MMLTPLAFAFIAVVPIQGIVLRHFQPPTCDRCAGHRGVTLATPAGKSVVASTSGVVEFVGVVGGRLYVVQRISPTVRLTYGDLSVATVGQGSQIAAGEAIGISGPATYLSVRVGEDHVEPLRALGLGRSRLVPSPHGSAQIVGSLRSPR